MTRQPTIKICLFLLMAVDAKRHLKILPFKPVHCFYCTMALAALKTEGLDALTTYRRLLQSDDPALVLLGLEGIGMLGRAGAPALDAVRPLARHADERIRNAVGVWLDLLDRR